MVAVKPGTRLRSTTCSTEVVVVKATAGELAIECGGKEMVELGTDVGEPTGPSAGADGGTLLGKRYVDADDTVELLCTKAGDGSLSLGGVALEVKGAKPLPSSD